MCPKFSGIICFIGSKRSSSVVDQPFKPKEGFPTSSEGAQSPSVHGCIPKRLGCSIKASQSQWNVESDGVKASHKHSRAKSSAFSFKIIRKSSFESKSADFHRQLFSGCLSEHTGMHSLSGNVCPNMENHGMGKCQGNPDSGKTHSRESQCSSRFSVKKRQGDSDRMGIESSSVQSHCHCWHQPMVDLFATKLNHKLPMYMFPVPDSQAWETDALNISWEGLDGYEFVQWLSFLR